MALLNDKQTKQLDKQTYRQTDNKQSNRQDKNIQKRNGQTERHIDRRTKKETNCKNLIYVAQSNKQIVDRQ